VRLPCDKHARLRATAVLSKRTRKTLIALVRRMSQATDPLYLLDPVCMWATGVGGSDRRERGLLSRYHQLLAYTVAGALAAFTLASRLLRRRYCLYA